MVAIYCFGSHQEKDSLAWEIADDILIKGFSFRKCSKVEDLMKASGTIYLLDVVQGINEVKIIDDLSVLEESNIVSLHDFDVGYFIKFLKGLRGLKIRIIGLPYGAKKEDIMKDLMVKLESLKVKV